MPKGEVGIGLSWEPKMPSFSSSSAAKHVSAKSESSTLWKPSSELVDGLFVPPNNPKIVNKLLKKQVKDTAGTNWFDMPAPTMTPQLKKDLQLLKLRSAIDPKRHYKKGDTKSKTLPKYFQASQFFHTQQCFSMAIVGTVIESSTDYFSGRLTKKERKATLADELLSDYSLSEYRKRKVREIEEQNQPGGNHKWKIKDHLAKQRRH
ncbi:Fcf2 pre-rRNA processing, C-terminal [Dillenia turbinata]|uniref:Fcf2 pre-rRNA processing, C-terminal n=1 Tax=Dillenia turbinata TaxID=194707 RepID=A0AAN8YXW7_9MAGN